MTALRIKFKSSGRLNKSKTAEAYENLHRQIDAFNCFRAVAASNRVGFYVDAQPICKGLFAAQLAEAESYHMHNDILKLNCKNLSGSNYTVFYRMF